MAPCKSAKCGAVEIAQHRLSHKTPNDDTPAAGTWMYAFSSSMSPGVRRCASVLSSRSFCRWLHSLPCGLTGAWHASQMSVQVVAPPLCPPCSKHAPISQSPCPLQRLIRVCPERGGRSTHNSCASPHVRCPGCPTPAHGSPLGLPLELVELCFLHLQLAQQLLNVRLLGLAAGGACGATTRGGRAADAGSTLVRAAHACVPRNVNNHPYGNAHAQQLQGRQHRMPARQTHTNRPPRTPTTHEHAQRGRTHGAYTRT